ncbi:MAG: lantibiotic dehydratase [Candidatus Eremiobacteraeota bacterium]|nr:lantibiotic dehydratase [Candidatus Eremiobacteraeota bacterium]
MIAPEREQRRQRAPKTTAHAAAPPFTVVEELTLGRVPAWPAHRARALLAAPDWAKALETLLREDEPFRAAIVIASAGLRPVVDRVLAGEPLEARAATRLLAYAVRMATRTTPFGTFASVGHAVFDAEHERRVGDVTARVAQANVDHEWLVGAVDTLTERSIAAGEDVIVATATALRREGPRFALLDERKVIAEGDASQYRSVTVAATPPVAFALERARDGVSSGELARALADTFSVDAERAQSLVRKLVDARFLIAVQRPAPLDDAAERLAEQARNQPALAPLVDALRTATGPRRGVVDVTELDRTVARLKELGPSDVAQPVFHDLTHAPLAVPASVRDDVLRLADVLVRSGMPAQLDAFRKRFYERYESGERLVPLLELVGPHGIGIPHSFDAERPRVPPARRARLAALVGTALRAGRDEIALTDADWEAIRGDLPDPLPRSLELGFHVLAPSFEAATAGEYRIVSSPLAATYCAGMTTGRFAKYQDEAFNAKLREVVAGEAPPGALTAEPMFVPERARSGNVIAHPIVAEAILPINAHAGGLDALALDDLLVGIADERVVLWSRSRGRRVQPVWPHAFNMQLAPPLARFFGLVARDKGFVPGSFDVGELGLLPFVPRLRLGRVIVRRAAWTVPITELRETPLAVLARERGMVRYVQLGDFDNVLAVDTQTPAGETLLRDQLRGRKDDEVVQLSEAFVEDEELWLRDAHGARYCGEYIASVRAGGEQKPKSGAPLLVDERARTRTPASDWCYLKLYANDREFRSEVAPKLLRFAEDAVASSIATHWFYILYGDPDKHVRFRLHSAGDDAALRERALAFADELASSGVVNRFALATYERELERYGGAAGIELCERLFHLDSVAALRGPAVDVLTGRERIEAIAVPLLALFDALTTAAERDRYVDLRRPKAQRASADEAEALRVLARRSPLDDPECTPLARKLAALCKDEAAWLELVDSLLHMHLNRRGVSVDEERALRTLLWKALFGRRERNRR